ncbi:MAG: 16S rRNA (cytosine(1402)-N(4))-methyltransferase RsmH [bacterium]
MHTPVLLQKVVENLDIKADLLYVDATAGEGGHLQELLQKAGRVLALDADIEQIKKLRAKYSEFVFKGSLIVEKANFADLLKVCKRNSFLPVNGVLIDLGLSYDQINQSTRGFSYKKLDEVLDMRVDKSKNLIAADVVNSFTADELYGIFSKFSEDLNSRAIAKGIVRSRNIKKINKVGDLTQVIEKSIGKKDMKTIARIFQALRIETNNEINNLKKVLSDSPEVLLKGGKLLIITFHSVEDRIVKNFINQSKTFSQREIIKGSDLVSFERSAKLRVLIKN